MLIPRIELGTFSLQVRCTTTMQNELMLTFLHSAYLTKTMKNIQNKCAPFDTLDAVVAD